MDGDTGGNMDFIDSGVDAAAAELESGTGGGGEAVDRGLSPPQDSQAGSGAGVPPSAGAPTIEAWETLPKSWKKELEAHWTKFDPEVRKYVHEREKQALDGIMQYKTQADGWNELIEPFKPWLDQYQMDPREVTGRMLNAHLVLTHGTAEQRAQVAQALVQDYGLGELLGIQGQAAGTGQQANSPVDPAALRQFLQPIAQKVQQLEQQTLQERQQKIEGEVSSFMSNPANEFAAEVVGDMTRLLKQGLAQDLPSAYEMACRLNPEVSEKILQRKIEEMSKPKRPGSTNVTSNAPPVPTAGRERSIEDEMGSIYDSLVNR